MHDIIYQLYKKFGLLIRTNDGQTPATKESVIENIKKLTIDKTNPNLLNFISGQAPNYSSSLLSKRADLPILWYNSDFSEVFPNGYNSDFSEVFPNGKEIRTLGERTLVGIIFNNNKIMVSGGCVWDADSNLRELGTIPNTRHFNKTNPLNMFSQLETFDKIGNYHYVGPTTNNNNSIYNPLFLSSDTGVTGNELNNFIGDIGDYKNVWLDTLKKDAKGYNTKLADYLNVNYGTGLEPEILTFPKNKETKYNLEDILSIVFISDSPKRPNIPSRQYKQSAKTFLETATNPKTGWITPPKSREKIKIKIVGIYGCLLPNVPLDDTSSSQSNLGEELIEYINRFGYDKPLNKTNFYSIH